MSTNSIKEPKYIISIRDFGRSIALMHPDTGEDVAYIDIPVRWPDKKNIRNKPPPMDWKDWYNE